ncbi:hypothetical protein OC842_000645 [Tilletia horrida]|uniref:Uncharacterized protein n=1 Tax=Tilletia horrida TaxID=155126 RepID=A0AAN6GH07_9BASI|nr:hypothetical protein OC842_000645 [Tilletia horrida]
MSTTARAQRLNGDTSWLFSLPYFEQNGDVKHFNLVVDPWLDEATQVDFTFAFSVQKRVVPAAASSLQEVDRLIAERDAAGSRTSGQIDALVISHPFTDHAHPQTLLDGSSRSDIPLLCTPDALGSIQKLPGLPFQQRHTIPPSSSFDSGTVTSLPLPAGIRIVRLEAKERLAAVRYGPAWSRLHGGLAFIWNTQPLSESGAAETSARKIGAIVYSPHGITRLSLPPWLLKAEPRILFHSLHRQTLPTILAGPVALGFPNALELCQPASLHPTLLLGTHDEHKTAGGVVARLLRRQEWTVEEMEGQLSAAGSKTRLRVLEAGDELDLE